MAEGTGRLNTGEAELLVRELKNYMERIGIRRILEEHIDFGGDITLSGTSPLI